MGRPRKHRKDLPERVYYNHGAYYYVDNNNKWHNLGRDYPQAMMAWAKLIEVPEIVMTVGQLIDRYLLEVVPKKAERTQKDNRNEVGWLRPYFGGMLLCDVEPHHVASYRDHRTAKVRANRELALLSHMFNCACEWGLMKTNPCTHVRKNKEKPRDRYVEDEELEAFKVLCPGWLQIYIDIKNLIGLRQQDMLDLKFEDFTADGVKAFIKKVGRKISIETTDELIKLVGLLPKTSAYLFPTRTGTRMSDEGFQSTWGRRMDKFVRGGGVRFTEHDIRGKVATDIDDPLKAMKLLAHASMKTTEGYIKQRKTDRVQPHSRSKE